MTTTSNTGSAAALGYFDGVHLGHRAVLKETLAISCRRGLIPAAFTFTGEPPKLWERGGENGNLLQTPETRLELIKSLGIKSVCCPAFADICELSAEDFVAEILVKQMNAAAVVCGGDFRFGKNGVGDCDKLKEICKRYDISVSIVPAVEIDGEAVSSSVIRRQLRAGEAEKAAAFLGGAWFAELPVVHGKQLGRTLDAPTINQIPSKNMIVPKFGVYAGRVILNEKSYAAVANIGVKPTVDKDSKTPIFETHILGFDGDLYGRTVKVEFLRYLREERKFADLGELKSQISTDKERVLSYVKQ